MEIGKAYKRRIAREKKQQEKIDLAPVQALQPKTRSVRYDNIKSAMAEEGILAMAMQDISLLGQTGGLTGEDFSVPLLGKVFDQMLLRYRQGLEVSLGVLEDLTQEEMSHVAGIHQRQQGPANEAAFRDCVNTLRSVRQAAKVTSDDDLLAFQNKLRESKGTNK